MQPIIKLSDEQIAFFQENGFLAINEITGQDEVAWMRLLYDRAFAARVGREEGNQFDLAGSDEEGKEATLPQILRLSRYEPELQNCRYRGNALSIAAQLLGSETKFTGDHAILKPAFHGATTPWHQDEAYWGEEYDYNAISIWMPLQEVNSENGCMTFIPGSHRSEVMPHHSIGHDPRVHGLEIDEIDTSTEVACPLPAGGATIHLSRTMHYTAPNYSPEPRRAYILTFGTPPIRRSEARDFYWNRKKTTARDVRAKQALAKA